MVAGILVAELVDQQPVHVLRRPLLEPGVAEAQQETVTDQRYATAYLAALRRFLDRIN